MQDAAAEYKKNAGKDVAVTLDSVNFLPASDDPHDPSVATACPYPTPNSFTQNHEASLFDPQRLEQASRAEVANGAVAGAHRFAGVDCRVPTRPLLSGG